MDNVVKRRKVKEGVVVSNKMERTVTVNVETTVREPNFGKVMKRKKKYYADTANREIQMGQRVRIVETRPLSKLKRWRVEEILA
jgi:small subunit ribosomal protein S17